MAYGYLGTMRTRPGHRDEIAALLAGGSAPLRSMGCQSYVVSVSDDDPNCVWVHEVWDSEESHAASLQVPEVRAAIAEAMPKLTGEFTSVVLRVVGGLGVDG